MPVATKGAAASRRPVDLELGTLEVGTFPLMTHARGTEEGEGTPANDRQTRGCHGSMTRTEWTRRMPLATVGPAPSRRPVDLELVKLEVGTLPLMTHARGTEEGEGTPANEIGRAHV